MINIYKRIFLVLITLAAGLLLAPLPAHAASVTAHVRIVGTDRTIWFGNVTTDGCTVTDNTNVAHVFTTPVGLCALDAASKKGNFTYVAKDFGGSLGLFVQGIAEDTGAADFSTYWLYDVNGQAGSVGIGSYVVNSGDTLFFHFENPATDLNKRAISDGITYLRSQQDTTGQITGFSGITSWTTMSFAADGINPSTVKNGGASLTQFLAANQPASASASTDWERDILAITAAGANPFNFGGTDYVAKLVSFDNNSQIGSLTQVNDDMFGLLALVSAGSSASSTAKQHSLAFILAHQQSDGGFSWSTTGITAVDDTAAALQALVAAQKAGLTAPTLTTAITNAKNFMLAAKNSDGGYPYVKGDASNASSTAWAVMALNALGGQDVASADAYLRGAQDENGSFRWQTGSVGDTFTTAYAVHALTGKYWPVKVFAGTAPTATPTPTPTPTNTPTPTATPTPTSTPTPTPTSKPTSTPTLTPTAVPTVIPTQSGPTLSPTPGDQNQGTSPRDQLRKFRDEQRLFWKTWRENLRKQIQAFIQSFKGQ